MGEPPESCRDDGLVPPLPLHNMPQGYGVVPVSHHAVLLAGHRACTMHAEHALAHFHLSGDSHGARMTLWIWIYGARMTHESLDLGLWCTHNSLDLDL